MESSLHDTLKDDDLVVVGARGQRGQGLDVGGHVLQVMGPPHRTGQVGPALQHTAGNIDRQTDEMLLRPNSLQLWLKFCLLVFNLEV